MKFEMNISLKKMTIDVGRKIARQAICNRGFHPRNDADRAEPLTASAEGARPEDED